MPDDTQDETININVDISSKDPDRWVFDTDTKIRELLQHEQVRRDRTGDHGRGARPPSPKFTHPAADAHAAPSPYADPRPRPSVAHDPSTAEPEIIVEEDDLGIAADLGLSSDDDRS